MKVRVHVICLLFFSQLALAQTPDDRIEVTAKVPHYQQSLNHVLPAQKAIDETSFSADSLATLLNQSPVVNLNGQGGLFQAINIRGFARWRIQTLIEGIPIYTERRAGTAVEFIPPGFISQAFITQGAASTQLGSGAIGGGVDLMLTAPQQTAVTTRLGHSADYREVQVEGKAPESKVSWLLNHRHANTSEDANGNPILDGFEQHSIALRQRADDGALREGLLLYSTANNVAKASADDPADRVTVYPTNDHVVGKLQFDWLNTMIYLHHSDQDTQVDRPASRVNSLNNTSLDLGLQVHDELSVNQYQIYWRAGVDARTGVKASEVERNSAGNLTFERTNLDAQQWQAFLAAEFSRQTASGTWAGGTRLASQYQRDQNAEHTSYDTNLSAFVGYAHTLSKHWQWTGYLSHAYRVPSLTERYFDGATPRGTVTGSVDLTTETALNAQTSLTFKGEQSGATVTLFRQRINDYIERIQIAEDHLAYRNLNSATVLGSSYQIWHEFDVARLHWQLDLSGQWLDGENSQGDPVADISPAQHRLSLRAAGDYGQGFVVVSHRQSSSYRIGGERPVPSVTTLDAGYTYRLNDSTELTVNLTNLTNRQYVTSRDDLAPFARGRDVNVSCRIFY